MTESIRDSVHDNDYDNFAEAYATSNEANAFNAHYERPATLALVGDVDGRRVLDAGCGAGAHAAALAERGAIVTGVDNSAALLAIAAKRLGPRVPLHHADLSSPLPFPAGCFDVVLASLVMHYLRDWHPTLREFHRVLAPDGRLVISTHHPFTDHVLAGGDNYFATYEFADTWQKSGHTMSMRFWHRPLHAMIDAFEAAGFALDTVREPQPQQTAQTLFPEDYLLLTTKPQFIFFAMHSAGPA